MKAAYDQVQWQSPAGAPEAIHVIFRDTVLLMSAHESVIKPVLNVKGVKYGRRGYHQLETVPDFGHKPEEPDG